MKGLDLSQVEDQLKLLWTPEPPKMFTGGRQGDPRVYRMRRENLTCLLGGGRHDWESWGWDWANRGAAGIVPAEVSVCRNCLHDRR